MRRAIQEIDGTYHGVFAAKLELGTPKWRPAAFLHCGDKAISKFCGELRELCETCSGGF
jgi:hypothetical protein